MSKKPPADKMTQDFLSSRFFPDNQDCKGQPDVLNSVGKNIIKEDAWDKVTGRARYTADLKLPDCLTGKILRASVPHAHILSIDTSAAEELPGVCAVITGKDFHKNYGIIPWTKDERPLCTDHSRYIGDEIAAVAAIDEATANRALALIQVNVDLKKEVTRHTEDTHHDSILHEKHPDNLSKGVELEFGDVSIALEKAEHIVEGSFSYAASTHAALETHAALADFAHDGRLTIWSSTQTPHYLQNDLAKLLDLPAAMVRVIKPHVGGGFGGKSEPFAHEFAASLLSRRCGKPVKIVYSREESFLSHRGRHHIEMKMKLGWHSKTGLCLDYEALLDGGAYSSYGMVTTYYSGALNAGLYRINDYRWKSQRFFTNKPPAGPKRGHGTVQPRFALECLLDRLAEKLDRDPIALRKELFLGENCKTINQLEIGSSGFLQCLDKAAEAADWSNKFRKLPFGRGIGIAGSFYISGTNYPINPNLMPQSGIQIQADRSGLITVYSGAADIGQGSDCILKQLVADELGIQPKWVRVISADSDLCPVDLGSYSSRVTLMAGNAAISAARNLRNLMLAALAPHFNCSPKELVIVNDQVYRRDNPEKQMPFLKALELAESQLGTLGSTGSYTTPNRGGTYRGALVGASPAYSFTVQIAEVNVDTHTGQIRVEKIWAAHDCGKAINPIQVKGQIEGSVHMGLGEALFEETALRKGLLTAPNLLDYKIPYCQDTPEITALIVESPDPEGPYGAKEAGEGPLLPTVPAIANAIYDAVGVRLTRTPFLPTDVLKGIQNSAGPQL